MLPATIASSTSNVHKDRRNAPSRSGITAKGVSAVKQAGIAREDAVVLVASSGPLDALNILDATQVPAISQCLFGTVRRWTLTSIGMIAHLVSAATRECRKTRYVLPAQLAKPSIRQGLFKTAPCARQASSRQRQGMDLAKTAPLANTTQRKVRLTASNVLTTQTQRQLHLLESADR